ncbi:MAG: PLP-dependent aminotransferase family protein [Chloroflexota bacterium]
MTYSEYDLRSGYPHMDLIQRDLLTNIMADLMQRDVALQYTFDRAGDPWSREQLAAWMNTQQETPVLPDELHITAGAIPAIDQIARYSTKAGDIILVENPTFYYLISKLELNHCEVMGVPMEADGADLNALEDLCRQHGERISMFYCIPTYHNPTGYTYSAEKRRALVELAEKYNFTICEDSTYQMLYFDENDLPPPLIREFDTESGRVITAGSFNKLILPALRVGWIWGKTEQAEGIKAAKTAVTSAFMSQIVGELIVRDEMNQMLDTARKFYGDKYSLMVDALRANAPEWLQWVEPNGGYFIWLTLPEELTATDVYAATEAEGVTFLPGRNAFVRGDAPDRYMRICFAMQPDDVLVRGVEIMCDVLKKMPVTAG